MAFVNRPFFIKKIHKVNLGQFESKNVKNSNYTKLKEIYLKNLMFQQILRVYVV